MSRQVIVDDIDPRIQYIGRSWFQDLDGQNGIGNFGPTYMKTLHGTQNNDSLSFSFTGTSISIYGTTRPIKINNVFDPTIECVVDQTSTESAELSQSPENHRLLCGQEILDDGSHTITLNVTTTGNTFWLDYLTYTPSPEVTLNEAVLLIDSDDPAFLFDGGWNAWPGDALVTTGVADSRVKFDFIGKSISWVGSVLIDEPHAAASGSFVIDNDEPINFKLNGPSPNVNTTQNDQIFFTTPNLAPGPHSLVVTYNGGDGSCTPLTLDYVYVYVTNTSIPQPATGGATSSAPSSSASQGFQGDTGGRSLSKHPPAGAIVGGTIGGLALISLILSLLWWRCRKVQKSKYHIGKSCILPGVNPLSLLPASRNPGNLGEIPHTVWPAYPTPNIPLPPSTLENNASHATKTTAQPRAMCKGQSRRSRLSVLHVLHQDSGVRLPPPEDIPPQYTLA